MRGQLIESGVHRMLCQHYIVNRRANRTDVPNHIVSSDMKMRNRKQHTHEKQNRNRRNAQPQHHKLSLILLRRRRRNPKHQRESSKEIRQLLDHVSVLAHSFLSAHRRHEPYPSESDSCRRDQYTARERLKKLRMPHALYYDANITMTDAGRALMQVKRRRRDSSRARSRSRFPLGLLVSRVAQHRNCRPAFSHRHVARSSARARPHIRR